MDTDMTLVLSLVTIVMAIAVILRVWRRSYRPFELFSDVDALFVKNARDAFMTHTSPEGWGAISNECALKNCLLGMKLRLSQGLITDLKRFSATSSVTDDSIHVEFGDFVLCARKLQMFRQSAAIRRMAVQAEHNRKRLRYTDAYSPAYGTRGRREYQVFLGGSCNPTTWRKDTAIPVLKQAGVTFYNPQVDDWSPDLIEIEQEAKRRAQIKFFVIDQQTRGVASMVEIAFLSATRCELMVVMRDFDETSVIDGQPILPREMVDLNRGHDFLSSLLHEKGVPLFDDIPTALEYTIRLVTRSESIASLNEDVHVAEPVIRGVDVSIVDAAHNMFAQYSGDSGVLSLRDTRLAVRSLLGVWVSHADITRILQWCVPLEDADGMVTRDATRTKGRGLSRSEFSLVVAALLPCVERKAASGWKSQLWAMLPQNVQSLGAQLWAPEVDYDIKRQVFLGGNCGPCQSWREDIAIPLLLEHGIDYFNPNVSNWSPRLIPLEAQAKQNCTVLLFFVGKDTRAIGTMVEAAHFIGEDRDVVLCLSDVAPNSVVDNEEITMRAAKDLNRGRVYLADLANRKGVPVFQSIHEAMMRVIQIVNAKKAA